MRLYPNFSSLPEDAYPLQKVVPRRRFQVDKSNPVAKSSEAKMLNVFDIQGREKRIEVANTEEHVDGIPVEALANNTEFFCEVWIDLLTKNGTLSLRIFSSEKITRIIPAVS